MRASTASVLNGSSCLGGALWELDVHAWARGDQTVPNRGPEDGRDEPVDDLDRRWSQYVGAGLNPRLHLARADRRKRPLVKVWEHMVPEVSGDLHGRRVPVHLDRLPFAGVHAEHLPPGAGIDIGPGGDLGLDLAQPASRVALAGEVLRSLAALRVLVPGPPLAIGTPCDAGHR